MTKKLRNYMRNIQNNSHIFTVLLPTFAQQLTDGTDPIAESEIKIVINRSLTSKAQRDAFFKHLAKAASLYLCHIKHPWLYTIKQRMKILFKMALNRH